VVDVFRVGALLGGIVLDFPEADADAREVGVDILQFREAEIEEFDVAL
jgi:hypothetical protein